MMDYSMASSDTKISSFPCTNAICRKDLLCRNYRKYKKRFGEQYFDFHPETFNLPDELQLLKRRMYETKSIWIVKPATGFAGKGIKVVTKADQIGDSKSNITVQKYVDNPFLIRGLKFDIRLYVLLTSIDPLRVYIYNDGLVRFATEAFSLKEEDLGNSFIHVTNSGVNKENEVFNYGKDSNEFNGYKWTFKTLLRYLQAEGHDCSEILTNLRSLAFKTILCGREDMKQGFKEVKSEYNCFKLFGFDVMLDEKLKPWLLEVNSFPSFEPEILDCSVNEPLIAEMFNIVGIHLTNNLDHQQRISIKKKHGWKDFSDFDPKLYSKHFNVEEDEASEQPSDEDLVHEANLSVLQVLKLIRSEEEISQARNFSRLYFGQDLNHSDYTGFLSSCESACDRLECAWEARYGDNRDAGREVLTRLSQKIVL